MIAVDGCSMCHQACEESHPIGWVRVRVMASERLVGLGGIARPGHAFTVRSQALLFCGSCFSDWWKGTPACAAG